MTTLTLPAGAALTRIASVLAPILTNSAIEGVARVMGLKAEGSNKVRKLTSVLHMSWTARTPLQTSNLVLNLVGASQQLHSEQKVQMRHSHADEIVREMRLLKLDTVGLEKKDWRQNLGAEAVPVVVTSPRDAARGEPSRDAQLAPAKQHSAILKRMQDLVAPGVDEKGRGRELDKLVFAVAHEEGLGPTANIRNPGEEIDVGFSIGGHHFLVECKWEADPIGLPPVSAFMAKVSRKAEGTFGVFLSMSSFVEDINSKASTGIRLNCIGLTGPQFMAVLEGQTTWRALVEDARKLASQRSRFSRYVTRK